MIPPVEERQIRPCYNCVHVERLPKGKYSCNKGLCDDQFMGYFPALMEEPPPMFMMRSNIDRCNLPEDEAKKIPCKFHYTISEDKELKSSGEKRD